MERAFAMSYRFPVPSPELRAEEARNFCLERGRQSVIGSSSRQGGHPRPFHTGREFGITPILRNAATTEDDGVSDQGQGQK
jgi:hypothetical protein